MLGPITRAVENLGSSTVNVPLSRSTRSARSRRVTSQPPSTGSHDTGSPDAQPRSSGCELAVEIAHGHRRAERDCAVRAWHGPDALERA